MPKEYYVNCPTCDHPNRVQAHLQFIRFADDIEPIMSLLEGTLNSISCPVCKHRVNLLIPLVAVNADLESFIIVVPENLRKETEKEIEKLGTNWPITYCENYSELYFAMAPWINSLVLPVIDGIVSGSFFDKPLTEQVSMLSPLILRMIRSQLDGKSIEEIFKFEGQASENEKQRFLSQIYTLVVANLIRQLLALAVRSREVSQLDSIVRERIPAVCLTPEILSDIIGDCIDLKNPREDAASFRRGYLSEYLNAAIHAHSKTVNPRGKSWVRYLIASWLLSQDKNVTMDSQFNLSKETIRLTVSFQDLWDVSIVGLSYKNRSDYERKLSEIWEMMKHFGFEEELAEMFETPPIQIRTQAGKEVLPELLRGALLREILGQHSFNDSNEKSIELGELVGGVVSNLLNNGQRKAASLLAEGMLLRSLEAKDYLAAITLGTKVVEVMAKAEEHSFAARISQQLMELVQDDSIRDKLGIDGASLMRNFFTERGNVFRYLHRHEEALEAYQIAEEIELLIAKEKQNPKNLAVLRRNRGIIYRETGRFRKAKEIFETELREDPDNIPLIHSLVVLELQANRFERALSYLDQIIELTERKIGKSERSEYLLTRGLLKHNLGNAAGGLDDLRAAYEMADAVSSIRALRVASAAMRFHSELPEHRKFIEMCLGVLTKELKNRQHRSDPSRLLLMAIAIAERFLEEGRPEAVRELLQTEFDWLDGLKGDLPWQYHFNRGWLAYQQGELASCWPSFERALDIADREVPRGEDVSFSPSWMQDKERFQQVLSSVAIRLVDCGVLPIKELLKIYEFTNGREIASRLESQLSPDEITKLVQQVSRQANRAVNIFFPMSTEETVRICHLSSAAVQSVEISERVWSKDEIRRIKEQTYLALKRANPADLTTLDNQLRDWEELGSEIGSFIESRMSLNSQVCFLPGRDLTGLPLHLLTMPDGARLLEKTAVAFAPNFATLLAPMEAVRPNDEAVAIVAVTKRRDSETFRTRALDVSRLIYEQFRHSIQTFEVTELGATHKDVIALLQRVGQIFFICHGAYAGPGRGFGICVADEHQLPPSLFPIAELPELERFILTWDDFEDIETCPRTVVSIACSSGLTEVVAGGTRHGLEQTLFGKGTRTLISPLWDIDQEAGLEWLKKFCQIQSQVPQQGLDQVYRETCLALKDRFSHPFFWGAFTLNGTLFTGG